MPGWLRVVCVNGLVFMVLCAGIEGCVRMAHPEIGPLGSDAHLVADARFGKAPGPRPGASGRSNGALFRASADGFWAYSANADTNTSSAWLFLGDSVTMGIGVHPDSTFAGRLAGRLEHVRILNPSLIGYSSDDYVEVFEAVLAARDDVVRATVFWCLNDLYTASASVEDPDQDVRRRLGPLLELIHKYVYTYQWLKAAFFDRPEVYYRHDARLYENAELLQASIQNLQKIAERCDAENIRCEIVLIPYEYQLRTDATREQLEPQQTLTRRLSGTGLAVYDPAEYLLRASDTASELFLFGDGIHLSSEGHALMAEYVASAPDYP